MREYFHPKEGVYYKRKTFEKDYALMGAGGGGAVGALSGHSIEGETDGLTAGLGLAGSLVSGLIGGYKMPKKIKSWWNPPPKKAPKRYPRRIPPRVVPSRIGDRGLVGNWLFYNGTGDTLYDYSGKGNHGTINGAKWTDKEQAGWALSFDGTDDYVDVPHDSSLVPHENPCGELTYMAWVKIDDITGTDPSVLWKGYTTRLYPRNGKWCFSVFGVDGNEYVAQSSENIDFGNWHFWTGVFSLADERVRCYVDGVLKAETAMSVKIRGEEGSDVVMGRRATGNYIKGLITSAGIYNRALSADEIKKIYTNEKAMFK